MTKQHLRKQYLARRLALTEAQYLNYNRQLCEIFFSCIDLSFIQVLHTFLPIQKNKEPDTWLILDRTRREFPHVKLSVPRVDIPSGQIENFYFEGLSQL